MRAGIECLSRRVLEPRGRADLLARLRSGELHAIALIEPMVSEALMAVGQRVDAHWALPSLLRLRCTPHVTAVVKEFSLALTTLEAVAAIRSPFVAHHSLRAIRCAPFVVHHSLPTIRCPPFVAHKSLLTVRCSPLVHPGDTTDAQSPVVAEDPWQHR